MREAPLGTAIAGERRGAASPAPAGLSRLLIAGGGTGGHLMPGLALCERALDRAPEAKITFFRTRRAVEDLVFAGAPRGIEVRELDLPQPGRAPWSLARFFLRAYRASGEIRRAIRESRPQAMVALGGYPSLPGIYAARREGVPLLLLEQNRAPGKVIRALARWADAVACPDELAVERLRPFVRPRTILAATGNPVRASVLRARAEREASRLAPRSGRVTLLVVGGSQGAHGLNRLVMEALPLLREFREKMDWVHITGIADKEVMEEKYRGEGFRAQVHAFRPDLPELIAGADLVVSRAGGTTVAEIAAIGVPSILVPYPHHRDRHQAENALGLSEAGAARVAPEASLDGGGLGEIIAGLLRDPAERASMESRVRSLGRPEAGDRVLELILRLVRAPTGGGTLPERSR